jgi:nucleoredoxin
MVLPVILYKHLLLEIHPHRTSWQVQFREIDGKIIGLYFAANWYPKCEAFTPVLAAAYEQLKERGAGFEVVLVSCDEDRPSFERFHGTMPWPAVPFGDLSCKKRLSERFQVEGIPRLVVLAPDGGAVVHPDAADLVHRYGERAFPFTAARVAELEADDQRKYASQTLEKLFSVSGKEYVMNSGNNEKVSEQRACWIGSDELCWPS